ncbi:3-phosphoshikimate 1-carboxyvinyltransferase [Sporolactobacillus kofuensis]|uniref:3-phosphoshikimate 1-carboxyvinyltransferase n=1 Tax=Sporolactobacillus kofuensis TaxID=269672 RepID=A0ABW1WG97_9BACL|nr:3-phosphoshikimate 1-carboxyvinyltransferase [Sporolactobacillus kofuensis]
MQIITSKWRGTVAIPPSKSYAHRAIIAAALAGGNSTIKHVALSSDMQATLHAMQTLGAKITLSKGNTNTLYTLSVCGISRKVHDDAPQIDCNESGSTLRFTIPIALALRGAATFRGAGRLAQRSLAPYQHLFTDKKIEWNQECNQFPLHIQGTLKPGKFMITGKISSQFISGLLFALPLLTDKSTLIITDTLESRNYVAMTRDVLKHFGVYIEQSKNTYLVTPSAYRPKTYTVEGDWSQAAFLLLMGLLGERVAISGLNPMSIQGDRIIESIFKSMGGTLYWEGPLLVAEKSSLKATTVNVSQCPDLAPAIAGAMALAEGRSVITGGKRLRDKESDRITSVAEALTSLGAKVSETEDGMIIDGVPELRSARVSSMNDHRLAMMLSALSVAVHGEIRLEQAEAVNKSWPEFYQIVNQLGGQCIE